MQFQVPQFIETEDKIVGPFSLRQFAYVGAAGVLSAMIYFVAAVWLWALASIVIFGIAFSLAFIRIEGRPFLNIMLSAFNFYWRPQTYVWQSERSTMTQSKNKEGEEGKSALEEILASTMVKTKRAQQAKPLSRESIATGASLRESWEEVQTGTPLAKKRSDRQFLEAKMAERYQIFQRITGDRNAAKRVDYR